MMNKDITPTSYCYCADVFSYPLFVSLGGETRLFTLDGNFFNLKQLKSQGLNEHSIAFPSFNLGRIVYSLFITKKKINSLLSFKPRYLCSWVGCRIPLYFNLLCLSSNNKEDKHFAKMTQKKATACGLRKIRSILPYKRLAKVLQILRSENTPETWRSAGQTLNSALNFPVWKLGKTFLSLIRLDINTDSLHISHNWGSVHRSLPFPFFNHI